MKQNWSRWLIAFLVILIVTLLASCTTPATPTLIPIPTDVPSTQTPVVVVEYVSQVIVATPDTLVRGCELPARGIFWNEEFQWYECLDIVISEPSPIPEVLPTIEPKSTEVIVNETATPSPTQTAVVVVQTVQVIVTATPTATPSPTSTITPTPTQTPIPTATPIPPFIQTVSGKGTTLTGNYNFLERPIVMDIDVTGSGEFTLNAITANGCLVYLTTGSAPYKGRMMALPQIPPTCTEFKQFENGTKFSVAAGSNVSWKLTLTQFGQPTRQNPPIVFNGVGQNIVGPILINVLETVAIHSNGDSYFRVDIYELYETDPLISHVIDMSGDVNGSWFVGVPFGTYMIVVDTDGDRMWELEIN